MSEIYVSIDVESSGPCPPQNYMMSLGAVAFTEDGKELDSFYVNLAPLLDSTTDPDTQKWWESNPEAYAATQVGMQHPDKAIRDFYWWCKGVQQGRSKALMNGVEVDQEQQHGLPALVPVAFGLAYDGLFLFYYLFTFGERKSPFAISSHASGLDIKSAAWGMRPDTSFGKQSKRRLPKEWTKNLPKHTHEAVQDALEQGHLFFRMKLYRDGGVNGTD